MTPTSDNPVLSNGPTTTERLRKSFRDRDYADAYARSALNAYIATQIKVIREQREWTQGQLADEAGMKQPRIAVMEDVNYSSWSISTLWRLAQAFHLRLKVSFEEFGTLPHEIDTFDRQSLERLPLEKDSFIAGNVQNQPTEQPPYLVTGGKTLYHLLGNNILLGAIPDVTGKEYDWISCLMGQGAVINSLDTTYNLELLAKTKLLPGREAAINAPAITRELPTI
ncbi:MAG: helix-turn-helix domain-containing protein [Acidobacteriia bacterium]|nr:helix-turn-helix domain-containing protein [Terriglobia bacterium]